MKLKIATILAGALLGIAPTTAAHAAPAACDRTCMSGLVDQLLASMTAHNPDTLPLAAVYGATENSHPAALGMMEAWRTITKAGKPSLLAIDTGRGAAYCNGVRLPIVGRVSMDSITIDVSALPEDRLTLGSRVEILGPHQSLEDVARDAGTIAYEILTGLGHRYRRQYR